MLEITWEQLDALDEFYQAKFRDELLVHFAEEFPHRTAHLDQKVFAKYIEDSIDEASSYGLTLKHDVCVFINIKVLMKAKAPFDKKNHGWVIDIMHDKSILEPSDRLNKLADIVEVEIERMSEEQTL